jgi:hypothetical protein
MIVNQPLCPFTFCMNYAIKGLGILSPVQSLLGQPAGIFLVSKSQSCHNNYNYEALSNGEGAY